MSDIPLLPSFLDHPAGPFGNPHHGIVDGTALADGGAGVTHPDLVTYLQNAKLWVSPAIEFVVPGHSFTAPGSPPAGVNWLDYAILAGANRALYQKNIFSGTTAAGHAQQFLVSFGVGDTWACAITSLGIAADSGGGTAGCTVEMMPFGIFSDTAPPGNIVMAAPSLSPCGQPLFSGGTDDFSNVALTLRVFDILPSGQSAILGIVRDVDPAFHGYEAPRGFLRLDITKTGVSLSVLKSRADMLVQVDQTYSETSSPPPDYSCGGSDGGSVSVAASTNTQSRSTVAENIFCAYFNTSGVVEYLRYEVSATFASSGGFGAYTINCSGCSAGTYTGCDVASGTVISATNSATHSGSVAIVRVSDSVVVASATFSDSGSYVGTASYLGGGSWHNVGDINYNYTGTALGGTVYNVNQPTESVDNIQGAAVYATMGFVEVFPLYITSTIGVTSYTATPEDTFGDAAVVQVGMHGLYSHAINRGPIETFVGAARYSQAAAIAGSATHSPVVSAHPRTGQITHKMVTDGTTPPPSYGWA